MAERISKEEIPQVYELAVNGCTKSFDRLVIHFTPILRVIYTKFGYKQSEHDDLLQELFLSIWKNGKRYDPTKSSILTWLGKISRNLAIDLRRKEQTQRKSVMSARKIFRDGYEEDADFLADEKLNTAIEVLFPDQIQYVNLALTQEMGGIEVAKVLNIKKCNHHGYKNRLWWDIQRILQDKQVGPNNGRFGNFQCGSNHK